MAHAVAASTRDYVRVIYIISMQVFETEGMRRQGLWHVHIYVAERLLFGNRRHLGCQYASSCFLVSKHHERR